MKGFVIYSENQTASLSEFLAHADGCQFTPVSAVSTDLVAQLGCSTFFNMSKAKSILHRDVSAGEIANTLSHIECWRKIAEDESIAPHEFAIVSEANLQLSPNYYDALQTYVNGYVGSSDRQIVLLECSREHEYWNNKIYSGQGSINSIVFQLIENYNLAYCQMYLIRKSFIHEMLERLSSEKPYWLAHRLTDFCSADHLIQAMPLIAQPSEKIPFLPIKVKSMDESLDFILENPCSVIRFGDGEFLIIKGISIVYQQENPELVVELENILKMESNENLLICLPPMFNGFSPYIDSTKNHWHKHLNNNYRYYENICTASEYGNTFISRPYIDWQDKSHCERWFSKLKKLWQDKDLLIVEGETSRSGVGNDLFENARSIARIICPATNAYSKIDEIQQAVMKHAQDKLILLMLGPTAKVLAWKLSELGIRAIDIGHIDSEYEWFKMGVTEKVKFTHKHTADFNEADIQLAEDAEYESQVIAKVL